MPACSQFCARLRSSSPFASPRNAFHHVSILSSRTQVAYNLKNHLGWLVLFPYFSPTGTANLFMVADFLFIAPVALIYASAYLGDGGAGMV